jgi:hypothetical protein
MTTSDNSPEVEGRYTETDPEQPTVRKVRGEYTRAAVSPEPEPDHEGKYTDRAEHAPGMSPSGHHGHYVESEHNETEPNEE